jgi:geranylgeranyl pyrophosphate synthase
MENIGRSRRLSIEVTENQHQALKQLFNFGEKSALFFRVVDDIIEIGKKYPLLLNEISHTRLHLWELESYINKIKLERGEEDES